MTKNSLHARAAACGVETSYVDIAGLRREAKPEAIEAVLGAMGVSGDAPLPPPEKPTPKTHAPAFSSVRRLWGVFLPLYAVPSERNWGAGDFSDLKNLVAWMARLGGDFVATLPLLPAFFEDHADPRKGSAAPSPYSPVSRLFWNEFFIDVSGLPELALCPETRAVMSSPSFQGELKKLSSDRLVDYASVMTLKRRILEPLATKFFRSQGPRRAAFEKFRGERPLLDDYALFRAEREGGGEMSAAYHRYVQWVADSQVAEAAEAGREGDVGLSLDFPLGSHPHGYDLRRFRDFFVPGVAVGAPPDPFNHRGQNWGFPPLNPFKLREGGFSYFRNCLRHHLRYAGSLRIDHVMAFHRLFWIPDGFDAADGVYVRYPAEDFYEIVCEESVAHRAVVIGEDLGTVPPEVREAMKTHGLLRSFVTFFEKDPRRAPEDCAAALNTHDMPPFAAAYRGGDDPAAAIRKELTDLARSPARAVVVNLEDLWLETRPQNVPGTTDEYPNWRRKTRRSFEDFSKDAALLDLLREIGRLRRSD